MNSDKIDSKIYILCTWAIPLFISFIFAIYIAPASSWGPDQAISYAQGVYAAQGNYPQIGLLNSVGYRNPNALILLIVPFIWITKNPLFLSILFSVFQSFLVLYCWHDLLCYKRRTFQLFASFVFLPLLLWIPETLFTSTELWAQYFCRTFICLFVVLMLSSLREKNKIREFFVGFLLFFLPAIHLGLVVFTIVAIFVCCFFFYKKYYSILPVISGMILAFLLTWLPWLFYMKDQFRPFLAESANGDLKTYSFVAMFTPFLEMFYLLLGNQLLQIKGGLLSENTLLLLSVSSIVRVVFAICAFVFLMILLKKHRHKNIKQMLVICFFIMIIFSLFAILGRAPYSQRNDFGLMFTQVFLLILFATLANQFSVYYRYKKKYTMPLLMNSFVCVAIVCFFLQMILIGNSVFSVRMDTLKATHFSIASIPIVEKIAPLEIILEETKDQKRTISIAYNIQDYQKVFSFVLYFKTRETQGFYTPEILYKTYLEQYKNKQNFRFVSPYDEPDYIITYPAFNKKGFSVKSKSKITEFESVKKWNYLALWRKYLHIKEK